MVPVGTKVSPEAKALFHLTCDDLGVSEYDAALRYRVQGVIRELGAQSARYVQDVLHVAGVHGGFRYSHALYRCHEHFRVAYALHRDYYGCFHDDGYWIVSAHCGVRYCDCWYVRFVLPSSFTGKPSLFLYPSLALCEGVRLSASTIS